MWCVADLDDTYIARMEDVLAVYEQPYSAAEPVVCVDEKPFRCTRKCVPHSPPVRDTSPNATMSIDVKELPTSLQSWNPKQANIFRE
jgi:hypothetical protein